MYYYSQQWRYPEYQHWGWFWSPCSHEAEWRRPDGACILFLLGEELRASRVPSFTVDSKHACSSFQRETLCFSSEIVHVFFKGCLLHTHPWKDSPKQRAVHTLLSRGAETSSILPSHWPLKFKMLWTKFIFIIIWTASFLSSFYSFNGTTTIDCWFPYFCSSVQAKSWKMY